MSLETNKYYLTAKGNEIIRRTLNTGVIEITSVKLGSGTLPEAEEDARNLTALVSPQQSFLINSIVTAKAQSKITVAVTNDKLKTGYHALEAGIYAKDPDTEEETLFAVAKLEGDFIPAYSKSSIVNQIYSIFLVIGDAKVTMSVDTDLYLLKKDALTIAQVYPVGSMYLALQGQNPNILWPTTKWNQVAEGTALLTAGENYVAGNTYGANTKAIEQANLPKAKVRLEIQESGSHQHNASDFLDEIGFDVTNGGGGDPEKVRMAYGDNRPYNNNKRAAKTGWAGSHKHSGTTAELGSGEKFDVMQASLAINVWVRIA